MPCAPASRINRESANRSGVQPWSRLLRSNAIRLTLTESRVGIVGNEVGAVAENVRQHGFAILSMQEVSSLIALADVNTIARESFLASWNDLPTDDFLADGGKYRFRRHASLRLKYDDVESWQSEAYRPHWQPKAYNKLHGGVFRTFAEVKPATTANPLYRNIIHAFGRVFREAAEPSLATWFVETHQFRIDARSGEGRPTPEGAHRDGVDYVLLLMLGRRDIDGAVTTIYDNGGKLLAEFMLHEPFTAMLLDDNRVVHATTPFRASGPNPERDTLVVTYRKDGFLQP
jgi:hypothetical protein